MRFETIVKTYYKFDELSEKAQEKAIEHFRNINVDGDFWYECAIDDRKEILKSLGFYEIEINFSGFWSQGDGASFTAKFSIPESKIELAERIRKTKKDFPNVDLSLFAQIDFFGSEIDCGNFDVYRICHRYSHENSISSDSESMKEFARDFSQDTYKTLESNYEFLTEDTQVIETIRANEYEFDENGN